MTSICKLCGETKKLCQSHIIPKAYIKKIKKDANQLIEISSDITKKPRKTNADFKDFLLCNECELFISKEYENYGVNAFTDKRNIIENDKNIYVTNFKYEKYFLFLICILWRAIISKHHVYRTMHGLNYPAITDVLKTCILESSLRPFKKATQFDIESLIQISIYKIVDDKKQIPQDIIDNAHLLPNIECGKEKDFIYYFMVDGFLITLYLSRLLSNYLPIRNGRMLDRKFIKIEKISFRNLVQLNDIFTSAANSRVGSYREL